LPFLNNISVKGLKTIYRNKELILKIWCYIIEYIRNLNTILADLKQAGCIISSIKFFFSISKVVIIGYKYNSAGRHPNKDKVEKIIG
ncbi:uncharacterized protein BDZ99DRAFT_388380, partial [Mytilinidion resinicola]